MRRSFTYRNIKDEKKKKIKTHCLAGRNYIHSYFIPKGMPVLNKINKIKDLLWTFNLKMKNTYQQTIHATM